MKCGLCNTGIEKEDQPVPFSKIIKDGNQYWTLVTMVHPWCVADIILSKAEHFKKRKVSVSSKAIEEVKQKILNWLTKQGRMDATTQEISEGIFEEEDLVEIAMSEMEEAVL